MAASLFPMKILTALVLLATLSCGAVRAVDLIADSSFQRGFIVKDSNGKKQQILRWNDSGEPIWETAQYYSKSSLADPRHLTTRPNGLTFRDDFQTFIVHPENGEADLILGVNGFNEYGGVYRKQGEPWPHEYVSQRISDPNGHLGAASPRLSDIDRVDLSFDFRLIHNNPHRGPDYNPSIHAAQFLFFLTVQNLNRDSKGYGSYYWFGISLYDSRQPVTSLFFMQDKGSALKKGTDAFIYNVGIAPFTKKIVANGDWVSIHNDILPYIRAGLQEAWKQGFLTTSTNLADYRFGGMVLGWEITGLDDVAAEVKNLEASAILKASK